MEGFLVILGAGESGVGAALLGKLKGWQVFVSDSGTISENYRQELNEAGIEWEQNSHNMDRILTAHMVVKSPGIPDNALVVERLKNAAIPVVSEIEFAGRYNQSKTICITGSNGKTTTTLLTYHLLKQAGVDAELAGNVGTSWARQIATGKNPEWYVLELSSFQLDGMFDFRANIAVLMNITPDHLDRYDHSMEKYINSKFRIVQNQTSTDVFVYCMDDGSIMNALHKQAFKAQLIPFSQKQIVKSGAYSTADELIITINDRPMSVFLNDLALQGKHNLYNSMAAGIVARVLTIKKHFIRESLANFSGVEHRLEKVATVRGIEFINDSKATNVNAAWYALECMEKPVIWMAGGTDKGNDYTELFDLARQKVKALICIGADNQKLKLAFSGIIKHIIEVKDMEEAVKKAYAMGHKEDVVLLSPACASFDRFKNYMDRGQQFKSYVQKL